MVEQILRGIVLSTPTRVSLVAEMGVYIDHGGHDRLAGKIHARDSGWRRHSASPADRSDVAIPDEEGSILDGCAGVADNQAGTLEKNLRWTARLRMDRRR
jgi:hypothetical protein